MLTIVKNESFYRASFRNRPIVSIDSYDGTVHRGPFQKYQSRWILINDPDNSDEKCYKNVLFLRRWIAI